MKVLHERGVVETVSERTILGVPLFQDLAIFPMNLITPFLIGNEGPSHDSLQVPSCKSHRDISHPHHRGPLGGAMVPVSRHEPGETCDELLVSLIATEQKNRPSRDLNVAAAEPSIPLMKAAKQMGI